MPQRLEVVSPRSRSKAAIKVWVTRQSAPYRARKTEAASKAALQVWCEENGWKVVFSAGRTGAPRTGIVDAVIIRIKPGKPDAIEIRLVQIKAGLGGIKAREITRLKKAVAAISTDWLLAAFDGDGQVLHLVPDVPASGRI